VDLNNALVSYILTGYAGFSSSAGHIGPDVKVSHDVSLLIPEIWARLTEHEREPGYLIENGYLEPLEDFEYQGRTILASRLGYRITERFVAHFLGKIFDNPRAVFTSAILRPESQDLEVFVDGVENICEAQERVARRYLEDGSIEDACPPLKALIHIMAEGHYQGRRIQDPVIRGLFSRHALLESDWYQERLEVKQQRDIHLARRMVLNLQQFLELRHYADEAETRCRSSRSPPPAGAPGPARRAPWATGPPGISLVEVLPPAPRVEAFVQRVVQLPQR
jgi:phosphoenolpyruvate carboxykinase (diphosphate)